MPQKYLPKIERAYSRLTIPIDEEEISFAVPGFGPNNSISVADEILSKNFKIPSAEQIVSLAEFVFSKSELFEELELKILRDEIKLKMLWVYNINLWTKDDVYIIQDYPKLNQTYDIKSLEEILKKGSEIKNVRFSDNGKIRFAPKNSYRLGGQTPTSLSNNGYVIASFGIEGTKKLYESTIENGCYIYGHDISDNNMIRTEASSFDRDFNNDCLVINSCMNNTKEYATDIGYGIGIFNFSRDK